MSGYLFVKYSRVEFPRDWVACVASVSVGFSARSRRFSLFSGAKVGANATLMEAAGRGREGEKRKRLPASPMILKNAPLTLSQLDKFTV